MSGTGNWQDVARRAMDAALRRGVKGVRAAAVRSRKVSVTWRTGRVDKIQESSRLHVRMSLYIDGRYTECSTNDLRPEALERFLDGSVAMCRATPPDPYRVMPDPALYAGREERDLDVFDPSIADVTPEERKQYAEAMEAAALAAAGDKAIHAETTCEDEDHEAFLIHSNGFEGSLRNSYFGAWAVVSLKDEGDKRPEGEYGVAACRRSGLPGAELVGRKAAEYGLLRLGAARIPTAKLTMIVENRAVDRLLGYLLHAARGRALQQKESFLETFVGKPFGSALFDLRDDPFVPGGFKSRLFDSEGITAKPLPVFERGVFRNFYIDTYYGKKLNVPPTTGDSSNLVLTPGAKTLEQLVANVGRGILVRRFVGGDSNSTTGDFSTGISGTLIERGKLTTAVAEMNIAGNHKEFWKRLVAVGNDPWPYSSFRVPSLVFDGIQFSGT